LKLHLHVDIKKETKTHLMVKTNLQEEYQKYRNRVHVCGDEVYLINYLERKYNLVPSKHPVAHTEICQAGCS
jgi:hypothetical protein